MENVDEILIMSDSGYPTSDLSDGQRNRRSTRTVYDSRAPVYAYRWYAGADGKLKYSGKDWPNGTKTFAHAEERVDSARLGYLPYGSGASSNKGNNLPFGYGGFNPNKNVIAQQSIQNEEERKQVLAEFKINLYFECA
jgi:hypothetical protein